MEREGYHILVTAGMVAVMVGVDDGLEVHAIRNALLEHGKDPEESAPAGRGE